jgi:hypothetical protein
MKKQTFTIAVAFIFSLQTKAQNTLPPNTIPQANIPARTDIIQQPNVSPHILKISSVTLSVDSSVHVTSGAGATKDYFKATVNYTGTGTIQYQWVLINVGAQNQPPVVQGTLQLNGTGTDLLFTERDHVNHNAQKKITLKITSPVQMDSNTITF